MVIDQQRPDWVPIVIDMDDAAVAGLNVELTRLRGRSPHLSNL
jgi:hypothetical protein